MPPMNSGNVSFTQMGRAKEEKKKMEKKRMKYFASFDGGEEIEISDGVKKLQLMKKMRNERENLRNIVKRSKNNFIYRASGTRKGKRRRGTSSIKGKRKRSSWKPFNTKINYFDKKLQRESQNANYPRKSVATEGNNGKKLLDWQLAEFDSFVDIRQAYALRKDERDKFKDGDWRYASKEKSHAFTPQEFILEPKRVLLEDRRVDKPVGVYTHKIGRFFSRFEKL